MKWMVTMVLFLSFMICAQTDGVIISEVMDGNRTGGLPKYIEITNVHVNSRTLTGWKVNRYSNGVVTATLVFTFPSVTLSSGECYVITSENTAFDLAFGAANRDATASGVNGNGNDVYELKDASDNRIDIFGIIGDASNFYVDSYAIRKSSINNGNTTYTSSEWTITSIPTGEPLNGNPNNFGNPNTHSVDTPLPVELSSFTAAAGNGVVTLRWVTQSEINNERFDVLRAPERNGVYQVIGFRPGQGNSNAPISYSLADNLVANGTTYWYKIADVDVNGVRTEHGPVSATPQAAGTEIITLNADVPANFKIYPAYPNPFNPSTNLKFDIPAGSQGLQDVKVEIYNTIGQKIRTLFEGIAEPATHSLAWDGADDNGQTVPGGVYFAVLTTGHFRESVKLTLVK